MKIRCPNCRTAYEVDAALIPTKGRNVQCSNCGENWFQLGAPAADSQQELANEYSTQAQNDTLNETDAVADSSIQNRAPTTSETSNEKQSDSDKEIGSFFRKSKAEVKADAQEEDQKEDKTAPHQSVVSEKNENQNESTTETKTERQEEVATQVTTTEEEVRADNHVENVPPSTETVEMSNKSDNVDEDSTTQNPVTIETDAKPQRKPAGKDAKRVPFEEVEARVNKAVQEMSERAEQKMRPAEKVEKDDKDATEAVKDNTPHKNVAEEAEPKIKEVEAEVEPKIDTGAEDAKSEKPEVDEKSEQSEQEKNKTDPENKKYADAQYVLLSKQKRRAAIMAKREKIRAQRQAAALKKKKAEEQEAENNQVSEAETEDKKSTAAPLPEVDSAPQNTGSKSEKDETPNPVTEAVDEGKENAVQDVEDVAQPEQDATPQPAPENVQASEHVKKKPETDSDAKSKAEPLEDTTAPKVDGEDKNNVEVKLEEAQHVESKPKDVKPDSDEKPEDTQLKNQEDSAPKVVKKVRKKDSRKPIPDVAVSTKKPDVDTEKVDDVNNTQANVESSPPKRIHDLSNVNAQDAKQDVEFAAETEAQKQVEDAKFAAEAVTGSTVSSELPTYTDLDNPSPKDAPPLYIDDLPTRPLDESGSPESIVANTHKKKIEQSKNEKISEGKVKSTRKKDRPFISGIIFLIFILFLLFLVYFFRGVIGDTAPFLRPYLETYGDIVDISKAQVVDTVDDMRSDNEADTEVPASN